MSVWFITGCSTGIGRLLAERAFERGDRVVATARDPKTLEAIGTEDPDRILRLPLDVRDRPSIEKAVVETRERWGGIDVLVNNAGYGYIATQEEGDLDAVRAMFETNVFGLIAVTQVALPFMRERGQGTIVQLSSIAGRLATPRIGFYQASKWAVEALSEALHHEVSSLGLRVIVIEPGRYETDFATRSLHLGEDEENSNSPYASLREKWATNAQPLFPEFQNPVEVVDAITTAVDGTESFIRVPVGNDATGLVERREKMGTTEFVKWMNGTYNGS